MVQQATAPVPETVVPDDSSVLDKPVQLDAQAIETPPIAEIPPETTPEATPGPSAPAETPIPPSPIPSTVPPEIQQYIARLEQQNQSAQQQVDAKALDDVTVQYAQQLAQEAANELGLAPEAVLPFVQRIAKRQAEIVYRQYQAERMRQGQINAALDIGKQYNVDPRILVNLPTPEAMIATAKQSTAESRVAALEAEVARLKKPAVPAQRFATGAQPGAGAGLTGDALEAAWLKHETTQPNRPNPYDTAYRAMLRG